jgi:large subunit ribosomal protein L15
MQLHQLQGEKQKKIARRIGRGGKRGKTSGRGHKGQKSRAGHSIRPAERDMIKRIPKLRGHGINRGKTVNSGKIKPETVNISVLEQICTEGSTVNPRFLVEKKILRRIGGRLPQVKILGNGSLEKKITVSGCTLSKKAHEAIIAKGGSVVV